MIKGIRDNLECFDEEEIHSPDKTKNSPRTKKMVDNASRLIKNTTSLIYRFETCGIDYKQKESKNLTYRDIEKVLILFRNAYSVIFL